MEELLKEIRKWFAYSVGRSSVTYQLKTAGATYPAWVIRLENGNYGVAIPYEGEAINESFNEVHLFSEKKTIGNEEKSLLFLVSEDEISRETFAYLCFSLVDPDEDGKKRTQVEKNPLGWWKEWKKLVGNTSIEKRPYAVLGELIVLRKLLEKGEEAKWNGPRGSSKDISVPYGSFEVKSTTSRYDDTVVIAGQFQLEHKDEVACLVFNRFEESENGESIDSVVKSLTDSYGQPEYEFNKALGKLGYPCGNSYRSIRYVLNEQKFYLIDRNFPQITPEVFKNSKIPDGIMKIEYTINLSVCHSETLNQILLMVEEKRDGQTQ